ncbi:hypothetical protein H7K13_04040 [Priestia aryabhattai]|nr:hypothetical protein [Priestia aryabhattai]MBY0074094.1 hypothetical protein [Priestia aryabhattai]MED4000478.1 hypothetical protein [Priestia aryabhattai]
MIGGQGEDSCRKSGTDETPQERKRRGGSSPACGKRRVLHGNQQRCNKRLSSCIQFVCLYIHLI